MNVITQCAKCGGDIEFLQEDSGAQSVCPLCQQDIVLGEGRPRAPVDYEAVLAANERARIQRLAKREAAARIIKAVAVLFFLGSFPFFIKETEWAMIASLSCIGASLILALVARLLRPKELIEYELRKGALERRNMTLCPDCGQEISTRARACPSCGAPGSKSRTIYQLLALFVGMVGMHNFYAGYRTRGFIQLFSIFFWWTTFVPVCVFLWVISELITMDRDATGRKMR